MCGICGIVNFKQDRDTIEPKLFKMRDIMQYRGPDGKGHYVDSKAALGHRRLSIIDIDGGAQPMSNEDCSIWVVFNGEIYNFKELRKTLKAKGHIFKTTSDTEVLVHLYEVYQDSMAKYLNGMFAFAIWDKRENKLLLVRDRLGIKPLYYLFFDETLIFASEIKSILTYLSAIPSINEDVLSEYFSFRFLSGENTFFQDIKSLLPGHFLSWRENKTVVKKYWDIEFGGHQDDKPDEYYVNKISELLSDSVLQRLISDVPLGTFNSGGVDSSLLTAYVAKMSNSTLNTFSVGFNEKEYDERKYAHIVAEKYGTNHHDLIVDSQEYSELLPKIIWHHDEPLNHAHSVQIFRISQLAKDYVTVVLTGEGADELFAGYPRYNLMFFNRIASSNIMFRGIFEIGSRMSTNRKLGKISQFMRYQKNESMVKCAEFIPLEKLSGLFNSTVYKESLTERFRILSDAPQSLDDLHRLLYLEQKTYLVSLLNRQDKMSMAASIESRVPFLDHRLVEFSFTIPARMKIRSFRNKYIVKALAQKHLPLEIVNRKKSGFGVGLSEWLREPQNFGGYLGLVTEKNSITHTYFDSKIIHQIIREHTNLTIDHSEFLWALLNFELWHRIYYKNEFV